MPDLEDFYVVAVAHERGVDNAEADGLQKENQVAQPQEQELNEGGF
jgi:hypothetical protein